MDQNYFPNYLVDKAINRNLKNIFIPRYYHCWGLKKITYAPIPFRSRYLNGSVHSDIQELVRRFYSQINIGLSFKNSFTVNSFFLVQRPHSFLCAQQCSLFINLLAMFYSILWRNKAAY